MSEETRITRRGLLAGSLGAAVAAILPKQAEAQPAPAAAPTPRLRKPPLEVSNWTLDISHSLQPRTVGSKSLRYEDYFGLPEIEMRVELDVAEPYLGRVFQAASQRLGQTGRVRTQEFDGHTITIEDAELTNTQIGGLYRDEETGEWRGKVQLELEGGQHSLASFGEVPLKDGFGEIALTSELVLPMLPDGQNVR